MAGLSQEQVQWLTEKLGLVLSTAGVSPPAAPGAAKTGAAKTGAAKPSAGGGGQMRSVRTPFGDFAYLASVESKVEPVLTEISSEYLDAANLDAALDEASSTLESIEEKYGSMDEGDIKTEVNHYTDPMMKLQAGEAQGAGIADDAFKGFLDDTVKALDLTRQNVKVTADDLKAGQLQEQADAAAAIGKEITEASKSLVEGATSLIEAAGKVSALVAEPENPMAWIDAAGLMFKLFDSAGEEFIKQAAALTAQAHRLQNSGLEARASMARQTMQNLQASAKRQETIVGRSSEDLSQKQDSRDEGYDTKKPDKSVPKRFKFADIKSGLGTARKVYDLAMRTTAAAHNTHTLVVGLQRLQGDPSRWMGNPVEGEKIMQLLLDDTQRMYNEAEPKVAWSKKMTEQLQTLYSQGGAAMASSPGKAR